MLCYQPRFISPTEELTSTRFAQLIVSDAVVKTIKEIRAHVAAAAADGSDHKADIARLKRTLPMIIWQATFSETASKKGYRGQWRKQSAARLNGLFMLDIDHVDDPTELFRSWWQPTMDALLEDGAFHRNEEAINKWCEEQGIVLVHVTPSGHGLRIVAKASMERGNLADNQHHLAQQLGTTADEACKDASRTSFCPAFEDILYINHQTLFNYDNPEYDEKYGPQYRGGSSRPAALPAGPAADPAGRGAGKTEEGSGTPDGADGTTGAVGHEQAGLNYRGVSYEHIIDTWLQQNGGEPAVGGRHLCLLKLAAHLRYICDNNKDFLQKAMLEHRVCKAYAADGDGAKDLAAIADSVCQKQLWHTVPKAFRAVLEAAGVQLADGGGDAEAGGAPDIDYDGYARRLLPLLGDSPGLREAVSFLPDRLKLGGVLAATAMLGTYLTRTWWMHFDGRPYRLSFLVYVVGAAASGKSFITRLDPLLMAPMQAADKLGRAAEQAYKEEQKRRKANEKLSERPHPVIRYCPSSTSNAILYRRLQDAIDPEVMDPETGEPLHLHLITVESELATALRAQVGSWAGKNDLELKSFHNEQAGVDYANAESTNGIMQVNWNQVISGTQESMSRKITPKNVLDGLVTRLTLFPMPGNDFAMIERRTYLRDHERECMLRQLGYKLEQVKGELKVQRLVDFCYDYEEQLTRQARIEQDKCLDYFRKRIPVIMMRHTLVRLILRQLDAAVKGEDLVVDESDLEFARLIGDWALEAQIFMFGQMVMDALEREQQTFAPMKVRTKTRTAYNNLPEQFTMEQMMDINHVPNKKSAYTTISRWMQLGLLKLVNNNTYQKTIKTI